MTSTDTPAGNPTALPTVIPAASQPSGSAIAERILDCFPSGSYALSALLRLLDIVEQLKAMCLKFTGRNVHSHHSHNPIVKLGPVGFCANL